MEKYSILYIYFGHWFSYLVVQLIGHRHGYRLDDENKNQFMNQNIIAIILILFNGQTHQLSYILLLQY